MRRTSVGTLVLLAVTTAAAGWALLRALASRAIELPPVPPTMVAVLVLISAVVLGMGWTVRQYLHGNRPSLDPIRAARTAVLAKASCYTGSLLTGWYAAQVLAVLGDLGIEAQRDRAVAAGLAVLGALLLAVVGLVVEWFCRIPPPEDPEDAPGTTEPSADPAAVARARGAGPDPARRWEDGGMTSPEPRVPDAVTTSDAAPAGSPAYDGGEPATVATLPQSEPFEPAGVDWTPVSPRLSRARLLVATIWFAPPVLALVVVAVLTGVVWVWLGAAVVAALAAWIMLLIPRQVRAMGYAERADDLLIRRGILFRSMVVVPYGRMQYVDVTAGPLSRRLQIASVQLHTASPGTDASIDGLPTAEAARLRDQLASRGEARLAGL